MPGRTASTLTCSGCNVSSTTRTSSASRDTSRSVSSRGFLSELGQHLLRVVLLAEEAAMIPVWMRRRNGVNSAAMASVETTMASV